MAPRPGRGAHASRVPGGRRAGPAADREVPRVRRLVQGGVRHRCARGRGRPPRSRIHRHARERRHDLRAGRRRGAGHRRPRRGSRLGRRARGAHVRPRRLRRSGGRARADRRRAPERVRVGGADRRARGRADRCRTPAPRAAVRPRELGVRGAAHRVDAQHARLVAHAAGGGARRDRAALLGGGAAHARALARSPPRAGARAPARERRGDRGGRSRRDAVQRYQSARRPDRVRVRLSLRHRPSPVPAEHRDPRRLPGPRPRPFGTSVPGLYIPGFPATRDFGPFFGFVRGAVPAARIIVRDIMRP